MRISDGVQTCALPILEQNRIIDPRIGIFQDAISSATHDLREAISKKYMPAMLPILPHDNPNGGVFTRPMPSAVMIENLEAATNGDVDALNEQLAYGHHLTDIPTGRTSGMARVWWIVEHSVVAATLKQQQ